MTACSQLPQLIKVDGFNDRRVELTFDEVLSRRSFVKKNQQYVV
jgi:hypothetical protein